LRYLTHKNIIEKMLLNIKRVLIFSTNFVRNISHPKKKWGPVFLTQYCAGGKIVKNGMGGTCGEYWGGKRCAQGVGGKTWGKEAIGETQT
jgi:hypothetical protein